jgi:hypothetical protein
MLRDQIPPNRDAYEAHFFKFLPGEQKQAFVRSLRHSSNESVFREADPQLGSQHRTTRNSVSVCCGAMAGAASSGGRGKTSKFTIKFAAILVKMLNAI